MKKAKSVFRNVKITLSGITPRDDNLEGTVHRLNQYIHREINECQNVVHIYNVIYEMQDIIMQNI